MIGSESVYCDVIDPGSQFPRRERVGADPEDARGRPAGAAGCLRAGDRHVGAGGRGDCCDVEAMEGFGVLTAAVRAGVPALEVRAV